MGRAIDAVKSIAVEKQATFRTENISANHIVAFQEDVRELRDLHTQKVVEILFEHSESVTSHHYIDSVTYRRRSALHQRPAIRTLARSCLPDSDIRAEVDALPSSKRLSLQATIGTSSGARSASTTSPDDLVIAPWTR